MKRLLKALAKALMIVLVGREAMATEIIIQDNCPSTASDYGSIDGFILRTKYGFDHTGNFGTIGTTKWLLDGRLYKFAPKVANSTYSFKGARASYIGELDQRITCSYTCDMEKKCSPYLEAFEMMTDTMIDNSIPPKAELLVKKGLWGRPAKSQTNEYDCKLDEASMTTDMCSYKYAKPV